MIKIKLMADIGYAGCDGEEYIFVDEIVKDDLDKMAYEYALEYASSWEGDSRLGFSEDATEEEMEDEVEYFYGNVCGTWEVDEDD